MNSKSKAPRRPETSRLNYLDATRAFALLLGIMFHASLSFLPANIDWTAQEFFCKLVEHLN